MRLFCGLALGLGWALLVCVSEAATATGSQARYDEAMTRTHRIRVTKMATEWKGKRVTLELANGDRNSGRLLTISDGRFVLQGRDEERVRIPVDDVVSVTLRAGVPDILLGGLLGVASGAVVAGVVGLGSESAGSASTIGGIGGFILGSLLGIRLLHRDAVVRLDRPVRALPSR